MVLISGVEDRHAKVVLVVLVVLVLVLHLSLILFGPSLHNLTCTGYGLLVKGAADNSLTD